MFWNNLYRKRIWKRKRLYIFVWLNHFSIHPKLIQCCQPCFSKIIFFFNGDSWALPQTDAAWIPRRMKPRAFLTGWCEERGRGNAIWKSRKLLLNKSWWAGCRWRALVTTVCIPAYLIFMFEQLWFSKRGDWIGELLLHGEEYRYVKRSEIHLLNQCSLHYTWLPSSVTLRANQKGWWYNSVLCFYLLCLTWGASVGKELTCSAGNTGDMDSVPLLRRSPGGGNGSQLQHSCLENSMYKGAWRVIVHGSQRVRHDWETKHTNTHV